MMEGAKKKHETLKKNICEASQLWQKKRKKTISK
jgi:hypothetical protein